MSTNAECGCFPAEKTSAISNPPGVDAIAYRVGTYGTFFSRMLADIGAQPALQQWRSRDPRDFGVGVLDLWAYLGDILTFYQERIANEAFLRTAVQRESVLRLAALIDYRLSPGSAATTYVAFTLDKDKTLVLPEGLRVQSVPGQDEKPQKFELTAELAADARYNAVRVFPAPVAINPFAKNIAGGTVTSTVLPAPGQRVVLFDAQRAERKEIAKRTGAVITWTSPVETTFTAPQMRAYRRVFRLFGNAAPSKYMLPIDDTSAPGGLRWQNTSTSYSITKSGSEFALEMTVEDVKPGTGVLVVYAPKNGTPVARTARITSAVARAAAAVGPLTGVATHLALAWDTSNLGNGTMDLRDVEIYELASASITLSNSSFPATLSGGAVYVPLTALADYVTGRTVALDDVAKQPHIATVSAVTVSGLYLVVSFTPALPRPLDTASAVMLGNVAAASHGETVRGEILGHGDASASYQKFTLKKAPLTHVPAAGQPNGVAPEIEVRVGGILWDRVDTLYGVGADDRAYTLHISDDAKATVQFGGDPGARLPSGRNNVVATYRQGLGPEGNVKAGMITTLLDRPAGLKSATNPEVAAGGSSPETPDMARRNAPNGVRSFGRVVSLRDFEDAARELATVAKARASLEWSGFEQAVVLTVAGEAAAVLTTSQLAAVRTDLDSRRDVNRLLQVKAHTNAPVVLTIRVQVDPAYLLETVQASAADALSALFNFDDRDLGQPVFATEIYTAVHAVEGVVAALLTQFRPATQSTGVLDVVTAESNQMLIFQAGSPLVQPQFESL